MSTCGAPFRDGSSSADITCTRGRHWRRGLHVHVSPGRRVEWYMDRAENPWGVQSEVDVVSARTASSSAVTTAPMAVVPRSSTGADTLELPAVASPGR